MLYLGIMFVLTVLFLLGVRRSLWSDRVAAGAVFIVPALPDYWLASNNVWRVGLAAIEMLHHGQPFGFLFLTLDSGNTLHWLALTAVGVASYYACQRSLGQLNAAWEEANRVGDRKTGLG